MITALIIIGIWLAFSVSFALALIFKPLPARTYDPIAKEFPEVWNA